MRVGCHGRHWCIYVFGSGIYGFPRRIITIIVPRFCCVLSSELMAAIKNAAVERERNEEKKTKKKTKYSGNSTAPGRDCVGEGG